MVGVDYYLVTRGFIAEHGTIAIVLVSVGFLSFSLIPVTLMAFIALAVQRRLYSVLPAEYQRLAPWITWLNRRLEAAHDKQGAISQRTQKSEPEDVSSQKP